MGLFKPALPGFSHQHFHQPKAAGPAFQQWLEALTHGPHWDHHAHFVGVAVLTAHSLHLQRIASCLHCTGHGPRVIVRAINVM